MRPTNWLSITGDFEVAPDGAVVFKGGVAPEPELSNAPLYLAGVFVSDRQFGGGDIEATITFAEPAPGVVFEPARQYGGLILQYVPATNGFLAVQLGGLAGLVSVQWFAGGQWTPYAWQGQSHQLRPGRPYHLSVRVTGSRVLITLDGIQLIDTNLPFALPRGQAGIWALSRDDISFSGFDVEAEMPQLFVVMQFTDPFNELYRDVIRPVGEVAGYRVVRADETYGPGVIIADIERQLVDARAIVADITPSNANVFWEVGYAFALRKPTILIAERGTQLPFDVSPFRTLFYDNTIAGKTRIEEGLRNHLAAIETR